ncbi:MAG TPA: prephenate dehydrogenase/arogenate dehydrogenase family protein [Nitrososphaeraceae archaeon]
MKKKIGIVGADGKMGKWFSTYFATNHNNVLYFYDIKKTYATTLPNVVHCSSLKQCVREADYVIICVSSDKTSIVIQKSVNWMKKGSAVLEISSIKQDVSKSLISAPKSVVTISIHPMFGPGAKKLEDVKILFVPVRDKKREEQKLRSILGDAKILVIKDVVCHDRLMALILGLIYYANLIIASVVSKENFAKLKKYSGTSFDLQSILFHSILIDDQSLISSILINNNLLLPYLKEFLRVSKEIFEAIYTKDNKKLNRIVRDMNHHYDKNNEIERSYQRLYSFIQNM